MRVGDFDYKVNKILNQTSGLIKKFQSVSEPLLKEVMTYLNAIMSTNEENNRLSAPANPW